MWHARLDCVHVNYFPTTGFLSKMLLRKFSPFTFLHSLPQTNIHIGIFTIVRYQLYACYCIHKYKKVSVWNLCKIINYSLIIIMHHVIITWLDPTCCCALLTRWTNQVKADEQNYVQKLYTLCYMSKPI